MKKHIWKLEYSITIFVILGIIMLFIPMNFENYWQANMISRWKERYDKVEYMFSVINAQKKSEILNSLSKATDTEQRGKLLIQLVKPYLRIYPVNSYPKTYKPKFLNGSRVPKGNDFYFEDLYFSEKMMTVVGLKDGLSTSNRDDWFVMMIDINGLLPPNVWGKDIFGIYIYDEGNIAPFGQEMQPQELKQDCSKNGLGLGCSYYYLIGGDFLNE